VLQILEKAVRRGIYGFKFNVLGKWKQLEVGVFKIPSSKHSMPHVVGKLKKIKIAKAKVHKVLGYELKVMAKKRC